MIKRIKSKITEALRGLAKIIKNQNGKVKKSTAPAANEFVLRKSGVTVKPKSNLKAKKLPKQNNSFKGSAYNGKGSVNTDAIIFRKSRG